MCQDEDENEDKNQSFGSIWIWFVRYRLYPERTKTFVLRFAFFALAYEQPITIEVVRNRTIRASSTPLRRCVNSHCDKIQYESEERSCSQCVWTLETVTFK